MTPRRWDPERDRDDIYRVWWECGWFRDGHEAVREPFLDGADVFVIDHEGAAEAVSVGRTGAMRVGDRDARLGLVAAVNAGTPVRRRGLAGRVTAHLVAHQAQIGCALSLLGIFDQGYYDKLGYGTGTPDVMWTFDPASLRVGRPDRAPVRLGMEHAEQVHASRRRRWRTHGGIVIDDVAYTRMQMGRPRSYGLGYFDDDGTLGPHVWFEDATGRYHFVHWLAFRDRTELHTLLGVVRTLADQVHHVRILQPPFQLQVLLDQPFRQMYSTKGHERAAEQRALSWWQIRVLDVPTAAGWLQDAPAFNLSLADPIGRYLPEDAPWRGCGGDWVVDGGATRGSHAALPTLTASVGAFTRLVLGVGRAKSLALTDDLRGPPELIAALDEAIRFPPPVPDYDY